jgi:frataxin-like iron-binding protein CyaY
MAGVGMPFLAWQGLAWQLMHATLRASLCSGPFRYDYSRGRWIYNRDGRDLQRQIHDELKQLLGEAPSLEADV